MYCDFRTQTYGKWILLGEHAVLRGYKALVFPIKQKQLLLHYQALPQSLSASFSGESGKIIEHLFWRVVKHAQHLQHSSIQALHGHFHIECNIPIGEGLGASAALCVALARFLHAQQWIEEPLSFAQELEHLFHGKSSGLDIAGVSSEQGIAFQKGLISPCENTWHPHWYLSSSGQRGLTLDCIKTVQNLWQQDPKKAQSIDKNMEKAVERAEEALHSHHPQRLAWLAESIEEGARCFQEWGLLSKPLEVHMQTLKAQGALAVKPTGSGKGGYVLSLWETPPLSTSFALWPIHT
jgi:mevalonate kinase